MLLISPAAPGRDERAHLAVLDGFRGIAILLVMLFHTFVIGWHPVLRIGSYATSFGLDVATQSGSLGVELFFYISGFVLFLPYARAMFGEAPVPRLAHFIDRRFIKIVPSYYLALAFAAFVFAIGPAGEAERPTELFRHAAFIHPLWEHSIGTLSGPFWSVGVEVEFYVLFPFIAWCMMRRPLLTFAVLFAIGEGFRVRLHMTGEYGGFWHINQLAAHIDLFGIGMLSAWMFVRSRRYLGMPAVTRWATVAAIVMLGIAMLLMSQFAHAYRSPVYSDVYRFDSDYRALIELTIALLILSSLFAVRVWQRIIANPVLVWLSVISYNLYLWHDLILAQCGKTGFPCSGRPIPWIDNPSWPAHYYFSYFIMSIAVAAAVTYSFERPLLRMGTRGLLRRRTAPRGADPAS